MSIIKAIDSSEDNVEEVRMNLLSLSFNGASGKVGFDDEGDRTGASYAVYKVINGKFVGVN
jgi:ABC-type branched-subunit amino acid transport system substrate-binding protein